MQLLSKSAFWDNLPRKWKPFALGHWIKWSSSMYHLESLIINFRDDWLKLWMCLSTSVTRRDICQTSSNSDRRASSSHTHNDWRVVGLLNVADLPRCDMMWHSRRSWSIRERQLSGVIVLLVEYFSFPTSAMSVYPALKGPLAEKLRPARPTIDELMNYLVSFPGHIVGPSQANYGPPELERASLRRRSHLLIILVVYIDLWLIKPCTSLPGISVSMVHSGVCWLACVVCGFVFLLFMASDRWKNRLAWVFTYRENL